jgi:hypothetical protein
MTRTFVSPALDRIFDLYRKHFSSKAISVVRRRDASEPDGGERHEMAYRVVESFAVQYQDKPTYYVVRGSWYPQDQAWDAFLSDEEFYAHYYVPWNNTLDVTERQKILQTQVDKMQVERAHRYIDAMAAQVAFSQASTKLVDLLAQYRELFGSPEPEDR